MKEIIQKILPHAVAVVLFALATMVYFSPMFFDGKQLRQGDIVHSNGSMQEVVEYRNRTGNEALWSNSVFGGMPAYQISVQYPNNWLQYLNKFLTLGMPSPAYMIFLALLGFYIMLLCFGVNPWLAIAGAFAYGLSTYFMHIAGAGHNTKMRAMAFMPPIIGGLYMAYARGKMWLGTLLVCLALGLQIRANHLQITYYTAIIVLIFIIFELVRVIKEKQYNHFVKTSAAMMLAVTLAVGVNITNMLLTSEYTSYSTRGQSELTDESGDQTKGLDKSYILNDYSYGIVETVNLFIPNFVGGGSVSEVGSGSPLYEALVQNNVGKQDIAALCRAVPTYWGDQRSTAGPVYIGAVVIFLFILGLFVVKGRVKWWLVTAVILSVLLAWGNHFLMLSDLFIDFFPGYNKFRTVSMILVIAELAIPLLGILALKEMFGNELTAGDKQKALKNSFFIAGGIALFFSLFPGLFSFSAPVDSYYSSYPDWFITALHDTRQYLLRMDSIRTFCFVAAAAAILWFSIKGKLKINAAYVIFIALIVVDLWAVDKRYLNDDSFRQKANAITASPADLAILQDKEPDYRVLNLTVDPFNDATTSYHHKSLGGYHGAKMKRYQQIIEHHLIPEINTLSANMRSVKTEDDLANLFNNIPVMNMLNTKYVIINPDQFPITNPDALGNAWPVEHIQWVDNSDAEIAALNGFDPALEVVADKRYRPALEGFTAQYDSTASIQLTGYEPNYLVYEYQSQLTQMVVFSEIFYDKGWNAYIDGELTSHIRANYILRAMAVPAGNHEIIFRFEPVSYVRGEKIALVSSIGIVLLVLGVAMKGLFCNRKSAAACH
jgi:hypothetical protein